MSAYKFESPLRVSTVEFVRDQNQQGKKSVRSTKPHLEAMGKSHVKYVTVLLCMASLLPIYFAVPLDTSSTTTTSTDTSTTEATKVLSSNTTKGFNTTDSSEESSETVDILLFPATVVKEFQILEIFGLKSNNSNSTESSTTDTHSTDKP